MNDFTTNDDIDMTEVQDMFRIESAELLVEAEKALLSLEKNPDNHELIQDVFRCAHSIKGCARVAGYNRVAEFVHGFEDLLDHVRSGQQPLTQDLVNFLLQFIDKLNVMVPQTGSGDPELDLDQADLMARLHVWLDREPSTEKSNGSEPPGPTPHIDGEEASSLLDHSEPATGGLVDLRARTIRVPIERLNQLMNLVGEIAIARGEITDVLENRRIAGNDRLLETHRESDFLYMDLQELAMKLRTVPIGPLFDEFSRPIRDLSIECGKKVQLVTHGGDAEVDTSVVEHLRDPINHMIRNAVYHGIEEPQTRLQLGKSPTGTITIAAFREASRIRVVIEDDGAGLNRERIHAKAKEKGLLPEGRELSDEELYQIIFLPGFTTTETSNQISGRGVGMDVVQRNLELLRGRVHVESKAGEGTRFTLLMPMTLAIIEGFRVRAGTETYVIPMESVREVLELPEEDRNPDSRWGVTKLRGKPLPYLDLKKMFNLKTTDRGTENLVVVRYGDKEAALLVDELYGEAQTVIKPLGRLFEDISGLAGSTIMGNGRIAFVLDVSALVNTVIEEMENSATKIDAAGQGRAL